MARSKNPRPAQPADNAAREALDALVADYSDAHAVAWLERKFSSFAPGLAAGRSVPPFGDRNERDYFASARVLGFVRAMPGPDGENRPLVVASVRMKRPLGERTSRLVQFSFAKKVVRDAVENPPPSVDGLCAQGLFFFHDDEGDFRLSLVSGRIDGRRIDWSSARRNSFYCRHGRPCNTMRKRLGAALPSSAKIAEAFSVEALTKEFYEHLFRWYEWACDPETGVAFPNKIGDRTNDRKMLPEAVIRLVTRLLFVWFVRERRLIPSEIFTREWAEGNLLDFRAKSMDGRKGTSYYRAVLQNLFFATLNVPPDERTWAEKHRPGGRMVNDHDIRNRFRFPECFREPEAFFAKDSSRDSLLRGVPFLNCALFDCLDRKAESGNPGDDVFLDGFSRDRRRQAVLPNALFFGDGSDETGHEGILNLLAAYDFTIDENAASDGDVALDPELLGKVFENLLGAFNPETEEAARKMTGSFYTPREIVDYMVEQSLRAHLRSKVPAAADDAKLDDLFARAAAGEGDKGLLFSRAERGDLLEALYGCRSLDPACGSGAFPMGMLHAMTRLLAVLDPTGIAIQTRILRRHKEDLLNLSRDDRLVRAEREKRTADLEKLLAEQTANPDYARKLWIIENCIYGVDIQPIAAQISKLRFYISLLCDQPDADAVSFVALPNLESKFVCANTLLPLPDPGVEFDFSGGSIQRLRSELREIRHVIFQARGWKTKRKYQGLEKGKRAEIAQAVSDSLCKPDKAKIEQAAANLAKLERERSAVADPKWELQARPVQPSLFGDPGTSGTSGRIDRVDANAAKRASLDRAIAENQRAIDRENAKKNRKRGNTAVEDLANLVAEWDPYDQNVSASFFDPDWMFDVKDGFDIVIGNPPYISHDKLDDVVDYPRFEVFEPFADIYCYFFEKAIDVLGPNGTLCFITSNSFLRANYGVPLRSLLRKRTTILELDDIEGTQVFDSAIVNTAISIVGLGKDNDTRARIVNDSWNSRSFRDYVSSKSFTYTQSDFDLDPWTLESSSSLQVRTKIQNGGKSLERCGAKIRLGLATGDNKAFLLTLDVVKKLVSKDQKCAEIIRPVIRGQDVHRYSHSSPLFILLTKNGVNVQRDYPVVYQYLNAFGAKFKKRGAKGENWWNLRACAFFDDFKKEKIIWIELTDKGRFSYSNSEEYLLNTAYFLIPPEGVPAKYLLGILNSSTIQFFMQMIASTSGMGTLRWINNSVKEFPIPSNPPAASVREIESLVDRILATKKGNPAADTSVLEKKIDEIVYKLYGLTEEEVAIVEGRSAAARPESPPRPGAAGDGRRTADDGRRTGGATKRPSVLDEDTDID